MRTLGLRGSELPSFCVPSLTQLYNPSVSCADSSLYTREPGVLPHQLESHVGADEGIGPYKILIGLQ